MVGLIRPDSGSVRILGTDISEDSWRVLERVGLLPGDVDWWPELTGHEILEYFAGFRPERPPVFKERLVRDFRLPDSLLDRKVTTYSRGERRKVGLVTAFQHDPELLILDEPTSGLDPLLRRVFFDHCLAMKERGRTIFLSSHNLFEAQQYCDHIGIVRQGNLMAVETMADLREKSGCIVHLTFKDPGDLARFRLEGALPISESMRSLTLRYKGPPDDLIAALSGIPLDELAVSPPSLEDLFLEYIEPAETMPGRDA
jgi:ABC-2 type transport system ATP-binding protein